MEQNPLIDQVLHDWVQGLSIDDSSGESIVTEDDINRLSIELTRAIDQILRKQKCQGILSKLLGYR